ncbi:MAG: exo-alpha-sialidase [Candidatus Hydrogenedentes bacterium]|nr:exo-alpha-sialidase [Candidatus Hydrogenedentota bacterium]
MTRRLTLATVIALSVLGLGPAMALEIGEVVGPVGFETIDGFKRTMENYGERVGTVLVFLSARSAAVEKVIAEIGEIYEQYRFSEILFVGVVPNSQEQPEELRAFVQNHGLRFPVYRDGEGSVARRFGATVAPEFFLLDREGALVYRGGLPYLEAAIRLMVARKPIEVAASKVDGTPISDVGPAVEIEDPYGDLYFASELIFRKIPGVAVHHCSTVTEAENGDLLCLWYGGSYESAEDQALYLARKTKDGCCWTVPERVVWNPGQPPGNAVIFTFPDGRVGIVWGRMEGSRPVRRGAGWGQCRLFQRISADDGKTWGPDEEIPGSMGWLPRNVPITLRNGEFVLPVSGELDERRASFLLVLQQDGKSWAPRGAIRGGSQPTVVQRDDGTLLCLMRRQPRIMQSVSTDNGETWSEAAPTELKNPDAGIAMTRLADGRIVLAFNDTDQDDRTPFNVIQSTDGGKTWKDLRVLEADWGEFSYPSLIVGRDGMLHLTYTYRRFSIKHSTFDEGWLTKLERPN